MRALRPPPDELPELDVQHLEGTVIGHAALIILTAGLASPLWFVYRAKAMNRLAGRLAWRNLPRRIQPTVCVLSLCAWLTPTLVPAAAAGWQLYFSLLGTGALMVQALATSRILRRTSASFGLGVSVLVAIVLPVFSPIYFQWKLNQLAKVSCGVLTGPHG